MRVFAGGRSKKVMFLVHCLLNRDATSGRTVVYPTAFRESMQFFLKHQVGIVQPPYSEFYYLGLDRGNRLGAQSPVTEENTRIRAATQALTPSRVLENLAGSVMYQVLEYYRYGFRVTTFLDTNRSPGCGVETTSDRNQETPDCGLFLDALEDRIRVAGLEIPLPGTEASGDLLNPFARLRPLFQLIFTVHETPPFM